MKTLIAFALCATLFACKNEKPADQQSVTASVDSPKAPTEILDYKYSDIGKSAIAALSSGDIDSWVKDFTDNAVFIWNNGDSLSGKPAITDYWRKRRTEVVDSLTFSKAIWLPIRVNQPQSIEAPGVWLLSWYQTYAKYKNGKSMTQWMHTDMHLDANNKFDRVIMYLDRAPINAATAK